MLIGCCLCSIGLKTAGPFEHYRRRLDGRRCVLLPAATGEIGTDDPAYDRGAQPRHFVQPDPFLIDAESVSTTAYCRLLSTIGESERERLKVWGLLADTDDRDEHLLSQ